MCADIMSSSSINSVPSSHRFSSTSHPAYASSSVVRATPPVAEDFVHGGRSMATAVRKAMSCWEQAHAQHRCACALFVTFHPPLLAEVLVGGSRLVHIA